MKFFKKLNIDSNLPDESGELIKTEIIASEKIKAIIFALIALCLLVIQGFILTFHHKQIYETFNTLALFYIPPAFTLFIFIRETQIRHVLSKRQKENKMISKKMQNILISNEVFENPDYKSKLFTTLGEVSIKGKTNPIEILKPIEIIN